MEKLKCPKCEKKKDRGAFYTRSNGKPESYCKQCKKNRQTKRRQKQIKETNYSTGNPYKPNKEFDLEPIIEVFMTLKQWRDETKEKKNGLDGKY